MALTLVYSVTGVKVKDEVNSEGTTLSNAVCQTYWKVVGTDSNGNTGDFTGATPFTAASVAAANFTDFADLQEANVVGWIQAVVDGDPSYKAHIESQIQKIIDVDTVTEPTLPWATEDDTTTPAPGDLPE
tara:strand:+ start:312 stop:701 length:390 start_codon:yes stop_codon:yes gene_type:complete